MDDGVQYGYQEVRLLGVSPVGVKGGTLSGMRLHASESRG